MPCTEQHGIHPTHCERCLSVLHSACADAGGKGDLPAGGAEAVGGMYVGVEASVGGSAAGGADESGGDGAGTGVAGGADEGGGDGAGAGALGFRPGRGPFIPGGKANGGGASGGSAGGGTAAGVC